jgi:hypothetical protein
MFYFSHPCLYSCGFKNNRKSGDSVVSWNKSMVSAFKVIGYSMIWWIVGIILIFIGLSMIGSQLASITNVFMAGKVPNFANVLIGLIVMAMGYIIIISGFLASFMKVLTELIVEETDESNTKLNKYEKVLKNF